VHVIINPTFELINVLRELCVLYLPAQSKSCVICVCPILLRTTVVKGLRNVDKWPASTNLLYQSDVGFLSFQVRFSGARGWCFQHQPLMPSALARYRKVFLVGLWVVHRGVRYFLGGNSLHHSSQLKGKILRSEHNMRSPSVILCCVLPGKAASIRFVEQVPLILSPSKNFELVQGARERLRMTAPLISIRSPEYPVFYTLSFLRLAVVRLMSAHQSYFTCKCNES
jgi:hypothetical protein